MPAVTSIPGGPHKKQQQQHRQITPVKQQMQPAVTAIFRADPSTPCPHGHKCKLIDDDHLSKFTHETPKACPNGAGCKLQLDDKDHAAAYTHPRKRCPYGTHCLITGQDPSHGSAYDHSPEPAAAAAAATAGAHSTQQQQQRALPTCQYGTREQCPLLVIDPMHEASYSHPAPAAAAAVAASPQQQQQQQLVGGRPECRYGAGCRMYKRGGQPHVSTFYHPQMCPLDADCPDQSPAHRDQFAHSCRYKQECHMFLGKIENPTHMRRYVH